MICDDGERYRDSYYNDDWLQQKGFELEPFEKRLDDFYSTGVFTPVA